MGEATRPVFVRPCIAILCWIHLDPPEYGRYMNMLAGRLGADVTFVEIKNAGQGIALARGASGELSMKKSEAVKLIHEYITEWVAVGYLKPD